MSESPPGAAADGATLGAIGRFLDRLLPADVRAIADEARAGRLLAAVMFFLSAAAFFFAWQSDRNSETLRPAALILFTGGAVSLLNWPLLWVTRSIRAPGLVVSLETVLVVFACGWFGAGPGDPSQTFLLVAPVVAAFIVGPAAGYAVAALSVGGSLVLFFAPRFGHAFNPVDAVTGPYFHTAAITCVLLILASVSYMYEESRRTNQARIEDALASLREKNLAMQAINAEMADRREAAMTDSRKKDAFLKEMRAFSITQAQALEGARRALAQLTDTTRAISQSAETLAGTSASSDARLAGVASSASDVQRTVDQLLGVVNDTSAALTQLTSTVTEMQRQLTALSRSAEGTSAAMGAMEESAARVEQGATRTAALAGTMIQDAERGHEAMRRAQLGVDEIRASSRAVDEAIRALGARVAAISRMNKIIEEVAVETNVLALNASIIAAQAGASGLGFSVVADQIKALASRTAGSTREIAAVIAAVKDESENASAAIARGEKAVEAGAALSTDAQKALELIVQSARASTEQVRDIEVATGEQARRARTVAESMGSVSRQVATALAATEEHQRASAQIDAATQRLRRLAPELDSRSRAQVEGTGEARRALGSVAGMASELSTVQGTQTRASDQALRAVEEIQRAQQGQNDALAALDRE